MGGTGVAVGGRGVVVGETDFPHALDRSATTATRIANNIFLVFISSSFLDGVYRRTVCVRGLALRAVALGRAWTLLGSRKNSKPRVREMPACTLPQA